VRAEVTLRVDGTARVVTIPRPILTYLGWITGSKLVIELAEDCKTILVRQFERSDVPSPAPARITYDYTGPPKV